MQEPDPFRLMALDWGIGGLPFFQGLCAALPGADLLYLSDSLSVPYGKQSPGDLYRRLERIAALAAALGRGTLAVACNAMSSVLPAPCSRLGAVDVFSLVHTFIASPLPSGRGIGLIGGIRTIESGIYQKALEGAGNRVRARPTQELSALIEAGDVDAVPAFLEKTLAGLGDIDALVLACTHYPAVSALIQNAAPGLEIIDPGAALLEACLRRLSGAEGGQGQVPPGRTQGGRRGYLTTGNAEESRRSAERAFGFSGLPFIRIGADLVPADLRDLGI
ncbi:MAG: aspartate/glutamate racemase family protein [Spirochaetaceae bacterium]|jgi:glutamate racemase|nr:aspartate/glutamate racemase family protein [Spirochaetaceae bacterium]